MAMPMTMLAAARCVPLYRYRRIGAAYSYVFYLFLQTTFCPWFHSKPSYNFALNAEYVIIWLWPFGGSVCPYITNVLVKTRLESHSSCFESLHWVSVCTPNAITHYRVRRLSASHYPLGLYPLCRFGLGHGGCLLASDSLCYVHRGASPTVWAFSTNFQMRQS